MHTIMSSRTGMVSGSSTAIVTENSMAALLEPPRTPQAAERPGWPGPLVPEAEQILGSEWHEATRTLPIQLIIIKLTCGKQRERRGCCVQQHGESCAGPAFCVFRRNGGLKVVIQATRYTSLTMEIPTLCELGGDCSVHSR